MVPTMGAEIADLECAPSARRWRRRRARRQRRWRPRTAYAAPDTMIEYVAPAGSRAAPAPVTEYAPTAAYAAPDTVIEYVAPAGTCAASAPVSEYAPTAVYAAHEAGCDEDASPKSTYGPLETMHTDVATSNGSSMATVGLGQCLGRAGWERWA